MLECYYSIEILPLCEWEGQVIIMLEYIMTSILEILSVLNCCTIAAMRLSIATRMFISAVKD